MAEPHVVRCSMERFGRFGSAREVWTCVDRHGAAGSVQLGRAWFGPVRRDNVWQGWLGVIGRGMDGHGIVRMVWSGRQGKVVSGASRFGMAGKAKIGFDKRCLVAYGMAGMVVFS